MNIPYPAGRKARRFKFWGLQVYAHPLSLRATEFRIVMHRGQAKVYKGSTLPPTPSEWDHVVYILEDLQYIRVSFINYMPMPEICQTPRWCEEGACSVARFFAAFSSLVKLSYFKLNESNFYSAIRWWLQRRWTRVWVNDLHRAAIRQCGDREPNQQRPVDRKSSALTTTLKVKVR